MSPFALFTALDQTVLEWRPPGGLSLVASPPPWLAKLVGEADTQAGASLAPTLFPFLELFLEDAERVWAGALPRLDSDYWTETAVDGEELHLEATAVRAHGACWVILSRDEQGYRERQLLMQRARDLRIAHEALSRDLERTDVATHCLVHDLANPLTAVLGVLSALDKRALPGDAPPLVHAALEAAVRLRTLVREILGVFAAGMAGLDAPAAADSAPEVGSVVASVVAITALSARTRNIEIETGAMALPDTRVAGDKSRLARIVGNLLDNAVRYSPAGHAVWIGVVDEGSTVRVDVEDQGRGIDPATRQRLFEKFGHGSDEASGTGLGLYFCRITVERWGGAIGCEQRTEGGTRFWIRLPKVTAARNDAASARP